MVLRYVAAFTLLTSLASGSAAVGQTATAVFTDKPLEAVARCTATFCGGQSDDEFIEKILYPATVLLYSQNDEGTMHMVCTATAIEKTPKGYTFATASHCVSEDDHDKKKAEIEKTFFFVTSEEGKTKEFLRAEVTAAGYMHDGYDFALLSVETDKTFPVVAIGEDSTSHSGDSVVTIAAPLGLAKQTLRGAVSCPKVPRPVVEDDINWTEAMILQVPGEDSGSSGSSVVCLRQRAICGFYVGRVNSKAGGQQIAIPVSKFKAWRESLAKKTAEDKKQ